MVSIQLVIAFMLKLKQIKEKNLEIILFVKSEREYRMKIGDIVTFDRYQWRILAKEENRLLLLTENIIDQRPYHQQKGDVTWENSEMRAYLNDTFYHSFTPENQAKILTTEITTPGNPWYDVTGGAKTYDRILLLSLEEAVCHYFGDSSKNLMQKSPKQRYWFQKKDPNNEKRRAFYDDYIWWWWLRTPGRNLQRAIYIHGDGNIGIQGNGTYRYSSQTIHPLTRDNSGGVRPALWLEVDA